MTQGQFAMPAAAEQPDATLETDGATLRALVFGGRPLAEAAASGALRIAGDHAAAAYFAGCFPRLTPALVR